MNRTNALPKDRESDDPYQSFDIKNHEVVEISFGESSDKEKISRLIEITKQGKIVHSVF